LLPPAGREFCFTVIIIRSNFFFHRSGKARKNEKQCEKSTRRRSVLELAMYYLVKT